MRRFISMAAIAVFAVTIAVPAFAQPVRGQRGQGAVAGQPAGRQERVRVRQQRIIERFRRLDVDNNGAIGRAEWPRNVRAFDRFDANKDGQLTAAELRRGVNRRARRLR